MGYYKYLFLCFEVGGEVFRCFVKVVFEGVLWNKNESFVCMVFNYGVDLNYCFYWERFLGFVFVELGKF